MHGPTYVEWIYTVPMHAWPYICRMLKFLHPPLSMLKVESEPALNWRNSLPVNCKATHSLTTPAMVNSYGLNEGLSSVCPVPCGVNTETNAMKTVYMYFCTYFVVIMKYNSTWLRVVRWLRWAGLIKKPIVKPRPQLWHNDDSKMEQIPEGHEEVFIHPFHQHELALRDTRDIYKRYEAKWRCDCCKKSFDGLSEEEYHRNAYHCHQCTSGFDLCTDCFKGYRHQFHQHRLMPAKSTLCYPQTDGQWRCDACKLVYGKPTGQRCYHCAK